MHELAAQTDMKTGECMVENFAIGRVDFGCITFPGMVNVANMNLDEIVFIRRKEVHVYPEEGKKPPLGQGLNRLAEITLHRIWPTDKQTKQPITDPQRILKMGYYKKIETATQDMDAQFIDYDPITGSWTFRVKHFSKYGLDDDEDDEDENDNLNEEYEYYPHENPIGSRNGVAYEENNRETGAFGDQDYGDVGGGGGYGAGGVAIANMNRLSR